MVTIIFRIFVATHVYAQRHVGVPRLKTLPSLPIPVPEFVRETTRIARKDSISVHFQTWQNSHAGEKQGHGAQRAAVLTSPTSARGDTVIF